MIHQQTILTKSQRQDCIAKIKQFPADLLRLVNTLSADQLSLPCLPEHPTLDGDWNIAQTIHHLADSHIHAYTRMKLILTEDKPHLKTWDQEAWAQLADVSQIDVTASVLIMRGLHDRWANLLEQLEASDFARVGIHSEMGELTIDHFVETYARHGHGHIRQIENALRAHAAQAVTP
ncbi:MAG: DinB family protein [Chloroflexi bacterium]|nr:DinB family protein [Chloroflexota bacterium]